MKVEICGADGVPEMVWAIGMKAGELRRAMDTVRERQDEFMARWRAIHGANE